MLIAAAGLAGGASAQIVIPPSAKAPASAVDTTKRGFRINIHQISSARVGFSDANLLAAAEMQLTGNMIDPTTTLPFDNIIDWTYPGFETQNPPDITKPFTFIETGTINYSQEASQGGTGNIGVIPTDKAIPGVNTGNGSASTDNIAMEALGYLELQPGTYTLAVGSDDGFLSTIGSGTNPKDGFNYRLGIFDGGRGVAESRFDFTIQEAGYYPTRLVWWEGGGGANVEFYQILGDGTRIAVNDPANANAIKAYQAKANATTGLNVSSFTPGRNAVGVVVRPTIQVNFQNGSTTLNTSSVKMKFDDADVTPTVTPGQNGLTTVTFRPPGTLAGTSTHTVSLTWADSNGDSRTETWSFTTAGVTTILPGSSVAESSVDKSKTGFNLFLTQVSAVDENGAAITLPNTTARAESQLRGTLIDPTTGQPYVNNILEPNTTADLINFNQTTSQSGVENATDVGNFRDTSTPSRPDSPFPGVLDGDESAANNNMAMEITTILQLPAGVTILGVNSDDGFRVTGGSNPAAATAQELGVFEGGRGSSDTLFQIEAPEAGFYPVRIIWYEGNGGANVEFFSVLPNGDKVLVNDVANANAIKAYRESNVQSPPILDSFSPTGFVAKDAVIRLAIRDQDLTVNQSSIVLKVNGSAVTPTKTVENGVTTITYDPPGDLAAGTVVNYELTFSDSNGTPQTYSYSFTVSGELVYRQFNDIGGGVNVTDLTNNEKYINNTPDVLKVVSSYELNPYNIGNNYGGEFLGYIVPETTDDYIFYLSADDHAELWLSTDDNPANAVRIAQQLNWNAFRNWTGDDGGNPLTNRISPPIHLEQGKKYFTRGIFKEGGGGDNFSVAWRTPSSPPLVNNDPPITGPVLRPFDKIVITQNPQSLTVVKGLPATFTVNFLSAPGNANIEWLRGGSPIPGEISPTYTIPAVGFPDDNGAQISVRVTDANGTATSTVATLTVLDDTTAPALGSVWPLSYEEIAVPFSEVVTDDALLPGNFTLSGGLTVFEVARMSPTQLKIGLAPGSKMVAGTTYTLTAMNISDPAGNIAETLNAAFTVAPSVGFVRDAFYYNITGGLVDDLLINEKWPNLVDEYKWFGAYESPQTDPNIDNFAQRMVGWFVPPTTGSYVFYIASDDNGQLWLSTDELAANATMIAQEPVWNNFREWKTGSNQPAEGDPRSDGLGGFVNKSAPVDLTAGKRYYLQALEKEGGGGDNLSVTYTLASAATPENGTPSALRGAVIETFAPPATRTITVSTNPVSVTQTNGGRATFSVGITTSPTNSPVYYQWQVATASGQFTDISGANGASYQTPVIVQTDDGKRYRVVISTVGNVSTTSGEATLSIGTGPVDKPQITATLAAGNINITWTNGGTLQGSSTVEGPESAWQDLDSDGAYSAALNTAKMFYRVKR